MNNSENKLGEWFKSPRVKKHLNMFTWYVTDTKSLDIKYNGLSFSIICEVIGCFVMGADPYIYKGFTESTIDKVKEIYELAPWERIIITKLFDYLNNECPRKKVKRIIQERMEQ